MSTKLPRKEPSALARLAIDLAPLIVFFGVNYWRGIFTATGAFMAAITLAVIVSLIVYRKVSALLWFSAFMVLILGGLTIWLHADWLIKMKPTLYYLFVAGLLLFGLVTGRNLLKVALGTIYPGLSDKGWRLLTRNWIVFFVAMAIANEIIWRTTSTSFWLSSKIWGFVPATFLFALANVPMLLRHGLTLETAKEEPPIPPSQ
ncbi:MAG TPA: inner membrane-spanning protein YciB [Allosphingosinicella sp.]|jgi:intracellular septation protein|nr:inner membrane-spanning protein YciB [Allosphingosinicella sp.]